jgi:hypothetical protein
MSLTQKLLVYTLIVVVLLLSGILCIVLGNGPTVSIGTSLVASGAVGVLELIYRRITVDETSIDDSIRESGLHAIYDHRGLDRYRTLMESVTRLDIAGYSLRSFRESFGQTLLHRMERGVTVQVRFLVVDPKSQHSRTRETLEGHPKGVFSKSIEDLINAFGNKPNVEIRLLPGDLTTMVFRLDNTMFVGPQFTSRPSRSTATLEIVEQRNAWLFHQYEQEFDTMWNRAAPSKES